MKPMRVEPRVLLCGAVLWAACVGEPPPEADPPSVPDEVLAAMERDLGQDRAAVMRRLAAEAVAQRVEPVLRAELAETYGGAWMNADGTQLVVATTDAARFDDIRAAGGSPVLVEHDLETLDAIKATLDAGALPPAVHSIRVDVARNQVVVSAADPTSPEVLAFAALSAVRVEPSAERPRPLYDARGGDEYIINSNTLCSVGFAVHGGFVSAGHCGRVGSPTAGGNWIAQGTFRGSVFPGSDHAYIELNGQWASLPLVNNHAGGFVEVRGSAVAPPGSSVCRSGRTTRWRCGVIQSHNVTINYAAGPVYGATQTTACAEGGDSGGSFISGNQAQGVTSGGSGNCASGGTTFYYPINPILSAYGLTLKTAGAPPPSTTRELVSQWHGKCIDVPSSNFVDGAPLQMWDCNGTGAQRWTFTGGTLQAGGKCMDVAWAATHDGAVIQLASCNGNRAQQFVLSSSGDLVSVLASKCVDIKDWNPNRGARLQIWTCAGTANQKWFAR